MTRLDQNRATAQLAMKAGVKISAVKGVIIWGNHSSTQFPDAEHATIAGKRAAEVIQDADWLGAQFVPTVQKRGAAVIAPSGASTCSSANPVAASVRTSRATSSVFDASLRRTLIRLSSAPTASATRR